MNQKIINNILFIFLIPFACVSQDSLPTDYDENFLRYLYKHQLFSDVLLESYRFKNEKLSILQADNMNYLTGLSCAALGYMDSAASVFSRISKNSDLYFKSKITIYYNYLSLQQYEKANHILDSLQPVDISLSHLTHLQQTGMALLQKDFIKYTIMNNHDYADFAEGQKISIRMNEYCQQLTKIQKKSPVVAGMLSALIPGLGKVYSGKPYQGLMTLLPIALYGAMAYEGYRKDGFQSPVFYLFGSLSAVFYIGNIWGSASSVKIKKQETDHEVESNILLDLRISLQDYLD